MPCFRSDAQKTGVWIQPSERGLQPGYEHVRLRVDAAVPLLTRRRSSSARPSPSLRVRASASDLLWLYLGGLGDYLRASQLHAAYCEQIEQVLPEMLAVGFRAVAYNQRILGRYEDALQSAEKSLWLAQKVNARRHEILAVCLAGAVHHARGDLEAAGRKFAEARP